MQNDFESAVKWLSENLSFDKDIPVSVFETNIRIVGGLLSGHLLATDSHAKISSYDGSLLRLAVDIADRSEHNHRWE